MTQQGYRVSTRRSRALFILVPLCMLIVFFSAGCMHKPQPAIPLPNPVKKDVEKKGTPPHWKVTPGAAVVLQGQTITWKAIGAELTILNPHKDLFENGEVRLVIPKDMEGSLKVSASARRGDYSYYIFVHDPVNPEFAQGSDPKIIIR